jgi:hypothetical protein
MSLIGTLYVLFVKDLVFVIQILNQANPGSDNVLILAIF